MANADGVCEGKMDSGVINSDVEDHVSLCEIVGIIARIWLAS